MIVAHTIYTIKTVHKVDLLDKSDRSASQCHVEKSHLSFP